MRLFIAVELAQEIKKRLGLLRGRFEGSAVKARWVDAAALHITLTFLGDCAHDSLPVLQRIIDAAAGGRRAQRISVEKLGFFGKPHRPRVLWAGIKDEAMLLTGIQKQLAERLAGEGCTGETKPYTPHVTLARVKTVFDAQQFSTLCARYETIVFGAQTVDSLVLFESRLTPEGAVHTKIYEAPFRMG